MNSRAFGLLLLAVLAACDLSGGAFGVATLRLSPILDSTFIGDTLRPRTVTYHDADGVLQPAGAVRWRSSDTTIARLDSITGRIVGRGRGAVLVTATANDVSGPALVIVSRPLDLTLLIDTVFLLRNDTLTLPVAVKERSGNPPAPWFSAPMNPAFTVDSASGRVTATSPGGPFSYTAHADTVSATGAVQVLSLTDTLGGRAYFSVLNTAIRHQGSAARGVNYSRAGGTLAFNLLVTVDTAGSTLEKIVVTLRDSVNGTGVFDIDSLSFAEAFAPAGQTDATCSPPRPWAIWSTRRSAVPITALSYSGGSFTVTQNILVPNGRAISGRFAFTAQRTDLYTDPLGLLVIRGAFVAPLTTDRLQCGL